MANMPGMRSSGRAGRPGRRERASAGSGNEAAGKDGAFSPDKPGCRNICSELISHPRSFTREKCASAQGADEREVGPFLYALARGNQFRCRGERRAHVELQGAQELLKTALEPCEGQDTA